MQNLKRFSLIYMTVVIILGACGGVFASEGTFEQLVSGEVLKSARLDLSWDNALPLKNGEKVARVDVIGDRVYVLTDHNYLFSVSSDNGRLIFGKDLAPAGFVVMELQGFEGNILTVIGNEIFILNADSGVVMEKRRLQFEAGSAGATSNGYVYFSGKDKRLHALDNKKKIEIFKVSADSGSDITAIQTQGRYVLFGSKVGEVVCMFPDRPAARWQYKADGGILAEIASDENDAYCSSGDSYVQKLRLSDGELLWRQAVGAMIEEGCVLGEGAVYQYSRDKGVSAMDKGDGRIKWELGEGEGLLAEAGKRAYVVGGGVLYVMDNEKEKQVYSVNFSSVTKYFTNTTDSRMYIANDDGRVACLKPAE